MRRLLVLILLLSLPRPAAGQAQSAKALSVRSQKADVADGAGACSLGVAQVTLHANNVMARLYNTGTLFWKGSGNFYEVPAYGGAHAIFASGIWLGGMVGSELRFAGTDYGPFEFWPGPLDEQGEPPADCQPYDRIFSVSAWDIDQYEAGLPTTPDIEEWPWELGAPVEDGDGIPGNYDLAGGDRPKMLGHQTAWWVMNDAGGVHGRWQTLPIGMEVQVTAYAVSTSDALDNTTFYRYRLIYRGAEPLTEAWFGQWVDADLGNAADDLVGSDTTVGMGYVYNGTSFDSGSKGYGDRPPALGYLFAQGPLVGDRRLAMTTFVSHYGDATVLGNPRGVNDAYRYLRGLWRDGKPITHGGTGYGGTVPTTFMFPGDPVARAYWSEMNTDGAGARNSPSDRSFLMSTGPFSMNPGDVQDIVVAIVWSRGEDHLQSVARLREDAAFVMEAFNNGSIEGYPVPDALPAPGVALSPDRLSVSLAPGQSTRRSVTITNTGTADLTWNVQASGDPIERFLVTSNSAGPLDPPEMGTFAFNSNGFPTPDGLPPHCTDIARTGPDCNDRPTERQQVGPGQWGINVGGGNGTFGSYMNRAITGRGNLARLGAYDYEWRFSGTSIAVRAFEDEAAVEVPFQIWNTGVGTPDDPTDDVRLIPLICETACGGGTEPLVFDIGGDHPVSGGANDPLSDWVYWYNPADMTPGESGYLKFVNGGDPDLGELGGEVLARQVIVGWNAGTSPPYPQALPEPGTIIRIETRDFWARPDSTSGTVAPGARVEIPIEILVGAIAPGVYRDTLTIVTRVPERTRIAIPVEITVTQTTSSETAGSELPTAYSLDQNYPNPFNPSTTIRFGLPAAGRVRLVLYDVLGRQVRVLLDETRPAGWHDLTFEAGDLPTGAFFYRLDAGSYREVRSMLLVR